MRSMSTIQKMRPGTSTLQLGFLKQVLLKTPTRIQVVTKTIEIDFPNFQLHILLVFFAEFENRKRAFFKTELSFSSTFCSTRFVSMDPCIKGDSRLLIDSKYLLTFRDIYNFWNLSKICLES